MRIGTRGSVLALTQAEWAAGLLGGAELVVIRTSGDEGSARGTGGAGAPNDKARFVREIEQAVTAGDVDLAVHSAKDVPGELPDDLRIAGVPAREDARDAWCGSAGSLDEVPEGARVGTSSLRRQAQLRARRPDLQVSALAGNVDTRLRKLAEGQFDGIVLALAGLRRLGRENEASFAFHPSEMVPAPGQGSLALQVRADNTAMLERAAAVTDRAALVELTAERAVVATLGASCMTPVGAHAQLGGDRLRVWGFAGLPDGSEWVTDDLSGPADDPAGLGQEVGDRMREAGATELLQRAAEEVDDA